MKDHSFVIPKDPLFGSPQVARKRKRLHDKTCAFCGHKWICHYKFDCRAPNANCTCPGFVKEEGDKLT